MAGPESVSSAREKVAQTPREIRTIDVMTSKATTPTEIQNAFRQGINVPISSPTQNIEIKAPISKPEQGSWLGSMKTRLDRWHMAKQVHAPVERDNAIAINSAQGRMNALRSYANTPGLDPVILAQVRQEQLTLKLQIDSLAGGRKRAAEELVKYYEPKLRDRLIERDGIDANIATAKSEQDAAQQKLDLAISSLKNLDGRIEGYLSGAIPLDQAGKKTLEESLAKLQSAIQAERDTIAAKKNVIATETENRNRWLAKHGHAVEKLEGWKKIQTEGGLADTLAEPKKSAPEEEIPAAVTMDNVIDLAAKKAKRIGSFPEAGQVTDAPQPVESANRINEAEGEAFQVLLSLIEASEAREQLRGDLKVIVEKTPGGTIMSSEKAFGSIAGFSRAWNRISQGGSPKVPEAEEKILKKMEAKEPMSIVEFGMLVFQQNGMTSDLVKEGVTRLVKEWGAALELKRKVA